ncbi:tetratricopeptide repeat protein [Colwellia sp. BRX10-3]|uniref:tetratricopeptide repeat protein n=1 Tax=Colwellia sp. BRX10-3 TaxID=2759844 RepID=UPI0015F62A8D|nr:tetratricopeptide repeat protein [Colwellia sp. BRX10-3]MBA6389750.1 tetratricopeptide repeat protein [Colwellia sp. BRX10-3]
MSVINQMLKDLDKRQSDQQDAANVSVPLLAKSSSTKSVLVIVAIIIVFNVVGILGWQLYSENKQLKSQAQQEAITLEHKQKLVNAQSNTVAALNAEAAVEIQTLPITSTVIKHVSEEVDDFAKVPQSATIRTNIKDDNTVTSIVNKTSKHKSLPSIVPEKHDPVVIVAPVEVTKAVVNAEQVNETVPAKSSLTISRTQLSPQALAANKITEAEQAMERNDIAKAESLFEEVLLVMPEHETARKQLAALWYGKRYYQDAVNLLSQGIALAPKAEEMRLMSARIYYEQGQAREAYKMLRPVNNSNSSEIQILLANVSAELNEHNSAIIAYKKLITLEPDVGRWWLGVAVSLDSLGMFVPARDAYKQSIARNNLSTSAMQFARQRLIELGE